MGMFDSLDDLFDDVLGLFGFDEDDAYSEDPVSLPPLPQVVTNYVGPPAPPPGPSGIQTGVDLAGGGYRQTSGAISDTDDKVTKLLKQIFASNAQARTQVTGIIDGIKAAKQQLVSDPSKAHDPQSLAYFNQYLDQQLGKVEHILDGAKIDGTQQAELLSALGDEYRQAAPGQEHSGVQGGTDQGGSGGGGGGQGGGTVVGGPGGGGLPAAAATDPGTGGGLADPFAGLGGGLGGLGGADPVSSLLGPAMAALSSLPGSLGGAGASLPAGALGALGDQLSGPRGGSDGGFSDSDEHDDRIHGKPDFVDDGGEHGNHGESDSVGSTEQSHATPAVDQGQPQPGPAPAPALAAPASAAGNPNLVVQMPDGSPVTATTAQHASALRAVIGGTSVADAWKQAGVELPPPGTPVTTPGDPSHLVPGEIAQYKSRDPIPYAGNGKIWLDGQLQPKSALPTGDFLAWYDPAALAGSPAGTGPAVLTATSGQ